MAATGGKTKQPDARSVSVKLPSQERGFLMELCFRRVQAGRPYDDTTQAGVVRDALRLLHAKEVGSMVPTEPVVVEDSALVEDAKADMEAAGSHLQAEYKAFCEKEGVVGISWEQFLIIRKLRIQKGGWAYGPNTL